MSTSTKLDETPGSNERSASETKNKNGSNDGRNENQWIELDIVDEPEQVRVLLWSYPRTVSTAFVRSVTMIPGIKIFNELFSAAFFMGPDRKNWWFPRWSPSYTYKHCKDRLESKQPDHDTIFAKEFALDMHHHLDWIPKGYRHTMLIRHPLKCYKSLKKMLYASLIVRIGTLGSPITRVFPIDWYFNRDLCAVYDHLKETTGETPIIIDSSDITEDPEVMMKWYCESTGLPFHPEMLSWNEEKLRRLPWEMARIIHAANWMVGCYKNALNSHGFIKGGINKDNKPRKAGKKKKKEKNKQKASAAPEPSSAAYDNDTCNAEGEACDSAQGADSSQSIEPPLDFELIDMSGLTPDVVQAVREDLPFYKRLYDLRTSLADVKRLNMKQSSDG